MSVSSEIFAAMKQRAPFF